MKGLIGPVQKLERLALHSPAASDLLLLTGGNEQLSTRQTHKKPHTLLSNPLELGQS